MAGIASGVLSRAFLARPGFGSPPRWQPIYPRAKRVFDIGGTLLLALPVLLVIAVAALLIRLEGGQVFYGQQRIGRGGKTFTLWKLRSMQPDADRRLNDYLEANPEARQEWNQAQKLRHDPRITKVGRVLRKYSIDELPQFFNVMLGHMSLVGPRPMLPEQGPLYPGTAYFAMRPGLTGLWQVSERNGCSFADRAKHDTRYAGAMSLWTDLWILALTPLVMMRGTGI